jgi:hypothetical protein
LSRSTVSELSIGAASFTELRPRAIPNYLKRARRAFDALVSEIVHWSGRCRRQAAALVELKYVAGGRPDLLARYAGHYFRRAAAVGQPPRYANVLRSCAAPPERIPVSSAGNAAQGCAAAFQLSAKVGELHASVYRRALVDELAACSRISRRM